MAPLRFALFVALVLGLASAVATRHRAVHGADFFSGRHLDVTFAAPPSLRGAPLSERHFAWPLSQGSGSLAVTWQTVAQGPQSAVTAVRVEPGADLVDGVEATVRVTGYDTVTVDDSGRAQPVGNAVLECVETAADGLHRHRLELRGDGVARPETLRRD